MTVGTHSVTDSVTRSVSVCVSVLDQLVAVKRMIKSCRLWGEEAVLSVLPRVKQLSSDKEMVIRQAIAEVLGPFAQYLVETMTPFCYQFPADAPFIDFEGIDSAESAVESAAKPNHRKVADAAVAPHDSAGQRVEGKVRAHYVIITELLPLIKEMLKDAMEVRQGAGSSLIVIAELLNKEQVYEHILKIVLHMAHDDSDDQKITALPVRHCALSALSMHSPSLCLSTESALYQSHCNLDAKTT